MAGLAQNNQNAQLYGRILRAPDFSSADAYNMSNYSYSYMTARSAAMGGAFASLGADLSSMAINPAGLGMYLSSEIGFTPSIINSKTSVGTAGGSTWDRSKTKFTVGNLAGAFTLYQGSGPLTSMTFGFGYNRLVDFNHTSGVTMANDNTSIGQIFAKQLVGINPARIDANRNFAPFSEFDRIDWGAILAYRNFMLEDVSGDDSGDYSMIADYWDGGQVAHNVRSQSKGYVGEYDISFGLNFKNNFYLGLTIGIQDIDYTQQELYMEDYLNNTGSLNYMDYNQTVKYSGAGVNFKLGFIWRPLPELRLGAAVHTPTFIDMRRRYSSIMYTDHKETASFQAETLWARSAEYRSDFDLETPTRLMVGASYTIANTAILSVDYEAVFYSGTRLKDVDSWGYSWTNGDFKADVKERFRTAHNIRAGLEVRVTPQFSLRGGYALQNRAIKDKTMLVDQAIEYRTHNYSVGAGYNFGRFKVDFAYVQAKSKLTPLELYYYSDTDGVVITHDNLIEGKRTRHNYMLSLGYRF